ncbi:RNA pseudouridylate synthase domain-containing protein 1-like [Arctopsyche grandis]|uniref:RNA pseudouridylate synthase domain-containing protein 1-like n=1 Tax=Arctopsyche grandis TaxID=121162 RepID=UPI00406D8C7B
MFPVIELSSCQNIVILHESSDYLIVDKPPDLLINSDDKNNLNTLQHLLMPKISQKCKESEYLKHGFHFIHRLDFSTSGVICLGRNKHASAVAGKLFEARLVNKYYVAIVRGHLIDEFTSVDFVVGYDENCINTNKRMCSEGKNCLNPKKAQTKILVLEKGLFDGDPATKILLKPLTGRRHQLRVHCHLLGHTIVGDYTYSDRTDIRPNRMFLHSLRLILPIESEPIDVCSIDPFTNANFKEWLPECVVNQMDTTGVESAFYKIDNFIFKTSSKIKK